MIDDEYDAKIRIIQASMIKKTTSSYSYSKALNEVLARGLRRP